MGIFNQPLPYVATGFLVVGVGIYAWRQPHRPDTHYFGWLIGIWVILAATVGFATIVQFGLQVMRQRAQREGGPLYINSKPGQGTRIRVCVPLADGD